MNNVRCSDDGTRQALRLSAEFMADVITRIGHHPSFEVVVNDETVIVRWHQDDGVVVAVDNTCGDQESMRYVYDALDAGGLIEVGPLDERFWAKLS